ncbi:protein of unknown function [Vibrio tapetis subsp. tapetis]|uniref:Uncharacterized protein n=1 Tax=Vibrio tapetis subsp. tapetis TaxID=1671868 RepID=A0A2N8ZBU9_9VIBR|nr:protein of unknown function [Vibrio tapetis subsp. tapetis]
MLYLYSFNHISDSFCFEHTSKNEHLGMSRKCHEIGFRNKHWKKNSSESGAATYLLHRTLKKQKG